MSCKQRKDSRILKNASWIAKNELNPHADWQVQIKNSITTAEALSEYLDINQSALEKTIRKYPMRITPYYLSLILEHGMPLFRQAVPDTKELLDHSHTEDPFREIPFSPVPNLIHRYPDRVVLLVTNACATYCRHCMRKRMVGYTNPKPLDMAVAFPMEKAVQYIQEHPAVSDVILSGGDPLLIETRQMATLIKKINVIDHVNTIRIHTRIPATLPQRITDNLIDALTADKPIYMNIHFNHPLEITDDARKACKKLADAGIPLGSQTVLLKGVNDSRYTLKQLFKDLLAIRVKPYYLHHPDPVKGTGHFRPSVKKGLKIMKALRGHISGMSLPHYMIDLPGGGGKVPLVPDYIKSIGDNHLIVENYKGDVFLYPDGQ
ncbi:MAG: KamA family radical SAM protein [Proteobacteria bacterium]|nr:KamA family radical SAM protein [Pseudomonadota bacterium]